MQFRINAKRAQVLAWSALGLVLISGTPALADSSLDRLPGPAVFSLIAVGIAAVIAIAGRAK